MEDSEGEEEMDNSVIQEPESSKQQEPTTTLKMKFSIIMKQLLYFLTEMEQFKPPSQKLK